MSTIGNLVDGIRSDLVILNIPIILEMAIYSGKQQIYSDLSRLSLSRMIPFAESFMLLGLGDNLSLSLDMNKSIVVSRVSERGVLIIVTSQKIGTVLIKLKEVIEKYGKRLDELLGGPPVMVPGEEVRVVQEPRPIITSKAEEFAAPQPPSPPPTRVPIPPTAVKPAPPSVAIETFMAPMLIKKEALKSSSGDEKKILSLCTGRFSIEEISKKTKIPAKTVIEALYKYSQNGILELREEKKTAAEEAINFLKRI
nr:hypothetical protein [Candidatus Njordarchaeota archaeon]